MHRKPEVELLPLDTEIERTLRNLKKEGAYKKAVMAKQRDVKHSYSSSNRGTSTVAKNYGRLLEASDQRGIFSNKDTTNRSQQF